MTPIAHLIGSVPLESADEVFRKVSQSIGQHVKRMPDGETDAGPIGSASCAAILAKIPPSKEMRTCRGSNLNNGTER